MEVINGDWENAGHYSTGIKAGDFLFVSGQLPAVSEESGQVESDLDTQVHQVLNRLQVILDNANLQISDLVNVKVYVDDIKKWSAIDAIYEKFMGDHKPTRAVVPTGPLHYGASLEIDAIAYDNPSK